MKILVAYYSQTGNTQRIARAVIDELSGDNQVDEAGIDALEPDAAAAYDLVFLGSPCHAGDLSAPAKSFLAGLPQQGAFCLAGFVTHASSAYEHEGFAQCITTLETTCAAKGIRFLDCFDCQGYLSPDVQPFVKKSRNISDEKWDEIVEAMTGHPDSEDEENARRFARKTVNAL